MSEGKIDISIIIPTLNSEGYIAECLEAIFGNGYPRTQFEVIAVDNGSSDGTLSILTQYEVHTFVDTKANVSGLRNQGALHARGKLLGFIDSDCIVSKDWIASAVRAFSEQGGGIGAVGHPYLLPEDPTWIERAWESTINRSNKQPAFLSAGNLVVQREFFLNLGGFNEKLITGEDYELCQRIKAKGYKHISEKGLESVHMGNAKTLLQFFKKEVWYGKGMLGTLKYDYYSKPLFLAFAYLFLSLLIVAGTMDLLINETSGLLITSAVPFFAVPVTVAFLKSYRSRSWKNFVQLIPIYFVYILGRMVSLFYLKEILTNLRQSSLQHHTF